MVCSQVLNKFGFEGEPKSKRGRRLDDQIKQSLMRNSFRKRWAEISSTSLNPQTENPKVEDQKNETQTPVSTIGCLCIVVHCLTYNTKMWGPEGILIGVKAEFLASFFCKL